MGARGRFSDDGAATQFSIASGNNAGAGAAATASGSTGARPAASPTGMRAGATENRKPTVTGGGSSVTSCVVTTVVGGCNKEGKLSPNSVG